MPMKYKKKASTTAPSKKTTKTVSSAPAVTEKHQPTATEMRNWFEKNKSRIKKYEDSTDAIKAVRDIQKSQQYKTISNYSKEDIKSYIKNIASQEKNLRSLSRYIFYRSQIYYRLCKYYANQMDLNIRSVIPQYDLVEEPDADSVLQSYNDTLDILDVINLNDEFTKAAITCMREDVFYGCCYYTEGEGTFIMPLDPDYCKIAGFYDDGSLGFAMNMSYFRSHSELLEYWGDPFESMYSTYQSSNEKWQLMPEEYAVCLKFRSEDWETVVPPLTPIFISLVNLLDQEDYQAIQDEANIYKLVWLEMKTMGNDEPDNWAVNPEIMIQYFNRMLDEALPDYISAAIVPGELHDISFPDNDASSDVTKVEKATKEILNTAGGGQILNLNSASNSTAFKYGVLMDSEFSLSTFIPQIQKIVNRLLKNWMSNPCRVKFFNVSIYQKEDYRKQLMESGQNGLPVKLLLNAVNGFSEKETMALNYLEEKLLSLSTVLRPFSTSYTQSSDGSNTKDDSDLTDAGLRTRDEDLNNK